MTEQLQGVDAAAFRSALSRFPSGVTIVMTRSAGGTLHVFTASSFAALSLDPPLVRVCPDQGADCFAAFIAAEQFVVNIVTPAHAKSAKKFATKGADKFTYGTFESDEGGDPALPDAAAVIRCELEQAVPGGDHAILIGRVHDTQMGGGEPVTWHKGDVLRLEESAA